MSPVGPDKSVDEKPVASRQARSLPWQLEGWARGIAAFLSLFSLLNLAGELRHPRFDATHWWITLDLLPGPLSVILLGASSLAILAWAIRPSANTTRRSVTAALAAALLIHTVRDAMVFYELWGKGSLIAGFPLPLSAALATGLGAVVVAILKPAHARHNASNMTALISLSACLVLFPFAQMICFGKTDYRRPVQAVVVFGARTYADGRPSDALADRVRTGIELYHQNLAALLVFTGGPGDGALHETDVMRQMALDGGVPSEAILLDPQGLNTEASVTNTLSLLRTRGITRIGAVSHFYHLPRIKMAFQRAGVEVYTTPAREPRPLMGLPRFMAREAAALWVYYLRPLA